MSPARAGARDAGRGETDPVTGLVLLTLASLWYTRLPTDGSYGVDLLVPFIVYGAGIAFAFVPMTIAALAGAPEEEAGLASGLINTSQQIGGAIGLAQCLDGRVTSYTTDLVKQGQVAGRGAHRRVPSRLRRDRGLRGRRPARVARLHPPRRDPGGGGGAGARDRHIAGIPVTGVSELVLEVVDLEAAEAFYAGVLGLPSSRAGRGARRSG